MVAVIRIELISRPYEERDLTISRYCYLDAEVGFEPTYLTARAYETPENDHFSTPHYGRPSRTRTLNPFRVKEVL
jgi:hypothetical protein